MTDTDFSGGSVDRDLPPPSVFHLGEGELPADLTLSRLGPVVLVLNAAADSGWAADAALAIARTLGRGGGRIVLADLHLEEPFLHERLGEPNLEGVTDIFLYGASLTRSARPVRGSGFYLIPAGTYTPDPEEVFRHSRWRKLSTGFHDANATLLVFAPVGAAGLEALARWSTDAIVLGDSDAAERMTRLLPRQLAVRAVLSPQPIQDTAPELDSPAEESEPWGSVEPEPDAGALLRPEGESAARWEELEQSPTPAYGSAYVADAGEQDRDMEPVAPPPDPTYAEPRDATMVAPPRAEQEPPRTRRRRGVRPAVWVALGLIAAAAGTYLVFGARADFFGAGRGPGAEPDLGERQVFAAPPTPPAAPVPQGDTLSYAIQVRAYNALAPAQRQVEEQERRFRDATFYITPELTQGILYYKVQAGLVGDTLAAAELRQRLVEARIVDPADARDDAPGAWNLIQYRPLAFDFGEFATQQEAQARADSLFQQGIPSYPVAVPYSDGTERWRLYGGAFTDAERAQEMRQLLDQAGVQAQLVPRIGRGRNTTG